jgi:hypothetical protein
VRAGRAGPRWRESGTRKVLQMTRGRLWITETAGAATARMFDFARRSPRIDRLYGYQWQAACDRYSWDSGWFRSNGSPRPAWYVVIDEVSADRNLAPAEIEALNPPVGPAMHDTCSGVG